jgi:hypothetical protein
MSLNKQQIKIWYKRFRCCGILFGRYPLLLKIKNIGNIKSLRFKFLIRNSYLSVLQLHIGVVLNNRKVVLSKQNLVELSL